MPVRRSVISPPAAEFPKDRQIIRVDDPARHPLAFEWKGGVSKSTVFQLSAKPLFSSLLTPEREINGTSVTVDGLPAGAYYWRIRSAGPDAKAYWSPIYQFRILQVFQNRIGRPRLLEGQLGVADDDAEHVVEVVRDAPRQPAHRLELLRLGELGLERELLGHVAEEQQAAHFQPAEIAQQ